MTVLGTFFLDPGKVWGPYGTSVKKQSSLDLALDFGAQRAHLKA